MEAKNKSIWSLVQQILADGKLTMQDIPILVKILMTIFTDNQDQPNSSK